MLRALYAWTLRLAAHRRAEWALGAVSFVESSIFPIPPDVMLIPMVLADRRRWLRIATICTAASVLGGLAGYAIGYFLFDSIGERILAFYEMHAAFESFREGYDEYGAWAVFGFALTFVPYKAITITSGFTQLALPAFILASVLGRGLRFYAVALLLWYYGAPIMRFIERWLNWLFVVFVLLLVGGFLALRLVF